MGLCAVSAVIAGAALAAPPEISETKQIMKDTVNVALTPRGQSFLLSHFMNVLKAFGLPLQNGVIESLPTFESTQPLSLENLSVPMSSNSITTLGELRDEIQKSASMFLDFSGITGSDTNNKILNDPMIDVDVQGIQYQVTFSHLGLKIDQKATARLHKTNSVIIGLQIETSNLELKVDTVRVRDAKNAWLTDIDGANGKPKGAGADGFHLSSLPSTDPKTGKPVGLKIYVPMEMSIDENEGLSFKALQVESNLPDIALDWGYQGSLILPDVEITVNGHKIASSSFKNLEAYLQQNAQKLATALEEWAKPFLNSSGPALINSELDRYHFTKNIENVNSMSPIRANAMTSSSQLPPNPQDDLIWGLIPKTLNLNQTLLFGLDTYLEDPKTNSGIALPVSKVSGAPELALDQNTYSLAVSVNEDFINRLIQLSFLRGYFKNVNIPSVGQLTAIEAPYLYPDPQGKDPHSLKLHANFTGVWAPDGRLNKLYKAVGMNKQPLKLQLDLYVKMIVKTDTGEIALAISGVDDNSVNLGSQGIAWYIPMSLVKHELKSALDANLNNNKDLILGNYKILKELFGIPIEIKDIQTDSNGNANVYVDFGALI